jgi:hypothetical protein
MSFKIETIACKCGGVFSACSAEHIDAEWKINREVYRLQGCIIEEQNSDDFSFSANKDCCEHRTNLFHIDTMLDDFREEIELELFNEEEADDDDDDDEYFDDEEE